MIVEDLAQQVSLEQIYKNSSKIRYSVTQSEFNVNTLFNDKNAVKWEQNTIQKTTKYKK